MLATLMFQLLSMTEYRFNPDRMQMYGSQDSLDSLSTCSGAIYSNEDYKAGLANVAEAAWMEEESLATTKMRFVHQRYYSCLINASRNQFAAHSMWSCNKGFQY